MIRIRVVVECEACTHNASNCNGDGFAFVGCGSGESSDVSTCTNCTALGMFVSGNGAGCEGSCPGRAASSGGDGVNVRGVRGVSCRPICERGVHGDGGACMLSM